MNKNLPQTNIKNTLSWTFGIILSFFGFIGVMLSDFIPGLILFLIGLVLLPPIGKLTESKWNFKLTVVKRTIFIIVGFFLFSLSLGSSDTPKNNPTGEQKATTEVKSEQKQEEAVVSTEPVVENETKNTEQAEPQRQLYPVSKVVDGDTVAVNIDGKQEVIRLIGINTPETVDPRKPVECFGAESSAKSKEILMGKKVGLEADETQSNKDKYGRPLRYIYLEDGINFNKLMVEEGYAYEYTYGTPYKYQADFKDAQQKAKDAKKGLWAENTCNGNLTIQTNSNNTQANSNNSSSQNDTATSTQQSQDSDGSCAGKTKCGQMDSCQEAKFYLNNCGVAKLDADKDGIPCETLCN
jgi:micrococcal nuclease